MAGYASRHVTSERRSEPAWPMRSPHCRTTTTRSSRTSTSRRCGSTTTSTTRRTWTRPTPRWRARSGPTSRSKRCSRTSPRCPPTSRARCATTPADMPTTRCSGRCSAPVGGGAPSGELGDAIATAFGGFDQLKQQMTDAGVNRFGSGWSWLVVDGGDLKVTSHRQPGLADLGRPDADPGHRRVGARLLPELPEPPARLPGRDLERHRLGAVGERYAQARSAAAAV